MLAGKDAKLDCSVRCHEAALVCGPALVYSWQAVLTAVAEVVKRGRRQRKGELLVLSGVSQTHLLFCQTMY